MFALLAAGAVVGGALLIDSGGGRANAVRVDSARAVSHLVIASRTLPALGGGPMLSISGDRLVVSDSDNTRFVAGHVTGECASAFVDRGSLRVTSVAHGNCGDPAVFGQRVIAVSYVPTRRDRSGWGVNPMAMRISVVDRSLPARYRLGPVIVTYPDGSDMRAETIEGDGALWVYAPLVGRLLHHGELLRVSPLTGRVQQRWRMPSIVRALLATDANGLWLAPSNESGFSEHASAALRLAQGSLYHVTPGVRAPARVFDVGELGARWLVAHGTSVWLARGDASAPPTLWRFDGPQATPTLRGAHTSGQIRNCGDLGVGPATVMGSAAGIFCLTNPNPNAERVQWLSASGGHSRVVASVPTLGEWEFADNAVLDRGAYYFVDPTEPDSPEFGRPVLYRVGPPRGH